MIHVAIIDDDPMVASINQQYIQMVPGFAVDALLADGDSALRYLQTHPAIDLILLDVYMPKMNGVQLLETIRRKFNAVDVIFVTAAREKAIVQRGLQLGAVDYLIKPFTAERMRTALQKYQQRYKLLHDSDELNQAELDQMLKVSSVHPLYPKGIQEETLKRIEAEIAQSTDHLIDPKALAKKLQVTVITIRVYLDYLESMNVLRKVVRYGTVGRPSFVYERQSPLH